MNQREYTNPRSITLTPNQGTEDYTHDWVYLSFFSKQGVTVQLQVYFKDDNHHFHRNRGKQFVEKSDDTFTEFGTLHRQYQSINNECILRNIESITNYSPKLKRDLLKQRVLSQTSRHDHATMVKRQKDEDHEKMKKFLLIKWDVIKQQRKQWEVEAKDRFILSKNMQILVKHMKAFLIIKHISEIYMKKC